MVRGAILGLGVRERREDAMGRGREGWSEGKGSHSGDQKQGGEPSKKTE